MSLLMMKAQQVLFLRMLSAQGCAMSFQRCLVLALLVTAGDILVTQIDYRA